MDINYNITSAESTINSMQNIVLGRFRTYLKSYGYNVKTVQVPFGALPPYKNTVNVSIYIKNPDEFIKSVLKRYNIEYNIKRNYYYRNEWTDSSLQKDLVIHIHTKTDIYNLSILLAKEPMKK